jgi:glycosyltransferase involved in cell wall biosynthesis
MIIQFNEAREKSGLGRYAELASKVKYPDKRLCNLVYDKYTKMYDTLPNGTNLYGFFPPITSGWVLNGDSALYATNREEFSENFKIMMENRENYRKRALERAKEFTFEIFSNRLAEVYKRAELESVSS